MHFGNAHNVFITDVVQKHKILLKKDIKQLVDMYGALNNFILGDCPPDSVIVSI